LIVRSVDVLAAINAGPDAVLDLEGALAAVRLFTDRAEDVSDPPAFCHDSTAY
jgi:hypothetical protein